MTKKSNQKPKFRSPYTYIPTKDDYEIVTGSSQTIPGEAYTIKELLEKFTVGISAEELGIKRPIQENDEDFDTVTIHRQPDFDLSDEDVVNQRLSGLKEKIKAEADAKAKIQRNEAKTKGDETEKTEAKPEQKSDDAGGETERRSERSFKSAD